MARGGKRARAGRPLGSGLYGEQTVPVRVPASMVSTFRDLLSGLTMATQYTAAEIEHHLKYEIDMLNGAYALIEKLEKAADETIEGQVLRNAVKESFVIHARALVEFFRKKKHENAARSFAHGYTIPDEPDEWQKLNNQVAHLMDRRTSDNTQKLKDADRAALMQWLAAEVMKFRAALAAPYDKIQFPDVTPVLTIAAGNPASATNAIQTA